jgi:hypothetical protein
MIHGGHGTEPFPVPESDRHIRANATASVKGKAASRGDRGRDHRPDLFRRGSVGTCPAADVELNGLVLKSRAIRAAGTLLDFNVDHNLAVDGRRAKVVRGVGGHDIARIRLPSRSRAI